jgi:hypothetical protein
MDRKRNRLRDDGPVCLTDGLGRTGPVTPYSAAGFGREGLRAEFPALPCRVRSRSEIDLFPSPGQPAGDSVISYEPAFLARSSA